MTEWQTFRRQVAVGGHVVDGHDQKPIAGAFVTIEGAAAARHTTTRPDGIFYFMELPAGKYKMTASVPRSGMRYGTSQATTEVVRDEKGNLQVSRVTLRVSRTAIQGRVTAPSRENGVFMAEVRVKGSNERVFTDAKGHYVLTGIEPGKRTILVYAKSYQPASEVVTVEQGASINFSFALTEESVAANGAQNAGHRSGSSGRTR